MALLNLPWWGLLLVVLVTTHITIVAVTVFLHRAQAHRAITLHPALAHFFRFWLWITTGMSTREWVAVHRKHHAKVESVDDPHSPQVYGLRRVLWQGTELYREAARDPETIATYGRGTPDDWLERKIYSRFDVGGISLSLIVFVALFGPLGLTAWAVQMIWIPFFAAGVVNGAGHWCGYRNFETGDRSTNLVPWGIIIGGEELHNNHHAYASSACFQSKPWEFDLGWFYIRLLRAFRLAGVRKLAAVPIVDKAKSKLDLDAVSAIINGHMHVMAEYAQRVVNRVHREEVRRAGTAAHPSLKAARRLIVRAETLLDDAEHSALADALLHNKPLEVVHEFRARLHGIFSQHSASLEGLLAQLQQWCAEAEQTGVAALSDFAQRLRGYTLATS